MRYRSILFSCSLCLASATPLAEDGAPPVTAGGSADGSTGSPPAALPDPARGTLRLFTLPGEADIYIDDQRRGQSPAWANETFSIGLPEGEYRLRAEKDGFGTVERTVFVGADTEQTIRLSLGPDLDMVPIAGGCFLMGSPADEPERDPDEGPQHEVCVPAFEIGRYEVTFDDWDACVNDGGCPAITEDQGWGRGKRPLIKVSWDDAHAFIRWLNRTGQGGYRLPTEAEWEYAARAGTTTPFTTGACLTNAQANFDSTFGYGDCPPASDEHPDQTMPVGSYPANPWGLHDMHGNVNEFVADCWHDGYEGAPTDGSAWLADPCPRRVLRGGSWYGFAGFSRSAYRCRVSPGSTHRSIGFRLARTPVAVP